MRPLRIFCLTDTDFRCSSCITLITYYLRKIELCCKNTYKFYSVLYTAFVVYRHQYFLA